MVQRRTAGPRAGGLDTAQERDSQQRGQVLLLAHARVTQLKDYGGTNTGYGAKEDSQQQVQQEVRARGAPRRLRYGELYDVGLLREAFQVALRESLVHGVEITLGGSHVALQVRSLVMLVLHLENF